MEQENLEQPALETNTEIVESQNENQPSYTEEQQAWIDLGATPEDMKQIFGENSVEEPQPSVETKPVDTDEDLQKMAEFGRNWQNLFVNDPGKALEVLIGSGAYTHEQIMGFADSLKPKESGFDVEGFTPETPLEQEFVNNHDWISHGLEYVQSEFRTRDENLVRNTLEVQVQTELLRAIADSIGLKVPEYNAYDRFMKDATVTSEVISKEYRDLLKHAVAEKTQREKPRPDTLRQKANGSGNTNLDGLKSMGDIMNYIDSMRN